MKAVMLSMPRFFLLAIALLDRVIVQAEPLPEFPGCTADFQVPDAYQLPSTSIEAATAFLNSLDPQILYLIQANYQPRTIACTGCSKGIGRQVACHFASLATTEKIISLATTTDLDPAFCPLGGDEKIVNVKYDIGLYAQDPCRNDESTSTSPSDETCVPEFVKILEDNNVQKIDFLLLNAVRDMVGPMRHWDANDIAKGLYNNVLGQHHVWKIARDYLNPQFAVAFGVSSVAAKTRFFPVRSFYHMSKQMLINLVLSYAVEEQDKQPNTNYAIVFNGDVRDTQYGIRQILPSDLPYGCQDILEDYGIFTNNFINDVGMAAEEVANAYHVFYNTIAAFFILRQFNPNMIPPIVPPQAFSVEPPDTFTPLRTLRFNHDLVKPEFTNVCYIGLWDEITQDPEVAPCAFYIDPRVDPCEEMCSAIP